ncbi:MAG: protein kinase [Terracidiphilus sp.]|jgi:serine/threonine-protein kinase
MSIPKTIGRYEIIDELGHGAMGSVYRAKDPAMDRIVAVKTILPGALAGEQSSEYRQRFFREARAAGALSHPGIVSVFDVGEHKGTPFLVMEFIQGRTLSDAIKKGERSSLERVCEIGQQIAEALGHAHRKGVIHRDIKPANILLAKNEADGTERAKITDFGVAKLAAGEITTTGQLLGTPAFMPPEQFTGAPIDGRADLFSLGVLLYWMASGEQPFPGETMSAVSYKIVHTEPVPPAKLNPAIPTALESLILKCLAKSPADRFQSGEELAQALAQLRAGARTSSLQATAPMARGTAGASEETYDVNPSLPPKPSLTSATLKDPQPAAPVRKKGALLLAAVILLACLAAGGGYLLHRHRSTAQPTPAETTASSQPAPADTTASSQTTPAYAPVPAPKAVQDTGSTKPSKAPVPALKAAQNTNSTNPSKASVPAPQATRNTGSATPSPAPAARTESSAVDFNPKTLDPKQNARLKLELDNFPPGLAVTVEMDQKIYIKGAAGDKATFDSLFVPPGVHEFRVIARAGGVQKASNIAGAEFKANKRMTLKAELRPPAKGSSASSPALNPAAQIVATLRGDRFFR